MKLLELVKCPVARRTLRTIPMLYAAVTVGISWLIIIVWLTVNLMSPAISWSGGTFAPISAYGGDTVEIQRNINVHKDVTYLVTRNLVSKIKDKAYTYSISDVTLNYEKGTYNQTRHWQIPYNIPAGNYLLKNTACYKEFMLFERCLVVPELPIRILEKGK